MSQPVKLANKLSDIVNLPNTSLSAGEYRQWITDVHAKIQALPGAVDRHNNVSAGFNTENTITPGLYVRELTMPAGSLVVSKIHLREHPFFILQGEVSVYDGEQEVVLKAPYKGITPAGTKRILYVHSDTVWITCHPTDKATMEEIDENGVITCDTFEEFDELTRGGQL